MIRDRAQQNVIATCEHGVLCVDDRPGHAMTLIRLRLATATPRGWADAVCTEVGAGGWVQLRLWETGEERWIWHHTSLELSLTVGDPVALHPAYSVLAVGRDRFNVAQL